MTSHKRYIVYMHTLPNGKRYIGTTYRLLKYRSGVNGNNYSGNKKFWNDIQKYGWDNIKHEILYENLDEEKAYEIEQKLISQYNTTNSDFGYNVSIGGKLHALGCKRTKEQKEKYSKSKMGDKNPQFGKTAWNRGIPCKEETKQKISEKNKGKLPPNTGTHLSEERRRHLHDINIGKVYVNDGVKEICITKEELPKYLDLGYVRGYIRHRRAIEVTQEV